MGWSVRCAVAALLLVLSVFQGSTAGESQEVCDYKMLSGAGLN